MSNKPMLSVDLRALLERVVKGEPGSTWAALDDDRLGATEELLALLDADKVNSREMGLMQYVEAHPIKPAAQHQGEPILIQAVAVTREDADEGLRLEWLLEGGIAEMEFPGMVLFAIPEANDLCDEDGSAAVYLSAPQVNQPAPVAVVMSDVAAVQMDHSRLVRELDVLLNGEAGAAKQASLCDIVAQVRLKRDLLLTSLNQGAPADLHFPTMLRKMWSGGEVQQWIEAQGPLYRKAPVLSGANAALQRVYDVIGLDYSHDASVLIENFKNIKRFSDYLHAIEREFFMVPGEPSDEPEDAGSEPDDECLMNCWGSTQDQYLKQFGAALAVLASKSPLAQAVANAGAVTHLYNSGGGLLAWIEGERTNLTAKAEPADVGARE